MKKILLLLIFCSYITYGQDEPDCSDCSTASTNAELALRDMNFSVDCATVTINYPFLSAICQFSDDLEISWDNGATWPDIITYSESASFTYTTAGIKTVRVRVIRDGVLCEDTEMSRDVFIETSCIAPCGTCNELDNYPIVGDVRINNDNTIFSGLGPQLGSDCDGNIYSAQNWDNFNDLILTKLDSNANILWNSNLNIFSNSGYVDLTTDDQGNSLVRFEDSMHKFDNQGTLLFSIDINSPLSAVSGITLNKLTGTHYLYYSNDTFTNQNIIFSNSGVQNIFTLQPDTTTIIELSTFGQLTLLDTFSPSNSINNIDFNNDTLHVWLENNGQITINSTGTTLVNSGIDPLISVVEYQNGVVVEEFNWFTMTNANNNNFVRNYFVLFNIPLENNSYIFERYQNDNFGGFIHKVNYNGIILETYDLGRIYWHNFKRQIAYNIDNNELWIYSDDYGNQAIFGYRLNSVIHKISNGIMETKFLMPTSGQQPNVTNPFYSRSSGSIVMNGDCLYFGGLHNSRNNFFTNDNVEIDGTGSQNNSRLTLLRIQNDLTIKSPSLNSKIPSNGSLQVWPNPTSNTDRINVAAADDIKNISLKNLSGVTIKKFDDVDDSNAVIDLSNLNLKRGVYLLLINKQNGSKITQQLIVK